MSNTTSHRLAAACHYEIPGLTPLRAADPERAGRATRDLERIARRHCASHGVKISSPVGGALIAVFESADTAVRTALRIRDQFLRTQVGQDRAVSLRIGVHVGNVAPGSDGALAGSAVDLASLVGSVVTEVGQVVISSVTQQLLQHRDDVAAIDLGEYVLDGARMHLFSVTATGAASADASSDLLQDAIAPLQLLDIEASGGMGEIHLARDSALRRTLAVKVLRAELASDAEARARFMREAQIIAGLSHPNIINVHSVGELRDGTPYFVMDYIEGGSLDDALREHGRFSVTATKEIISEVASALAAAHARGVVHRDIKPANVLYSGDRVYVSDWGVARLQVLSEDDVAQLTQTGMQVGSPVYMSPEQIAGEESGAATDVYALGLLSYYLLTGEGPFAGRTPREVMLAHVRDEPPSLATLLGEAAVDEEFDALMRRCLSKAPEQRPTASEVARRLQPSNTSLLEWPPPALERLHSRLRRVTWPIGVGSWLFALPIAGAIQTGGAGAISTPGPLLGGLVAILTTASLFLLWGAGAFVGLCRSIARATRSGFALGTIAEVVVDPRGDTGAVIAGQGEFAFLDSKRRGAIRRERVVRGALIAAAAMLPIFTLPLYAMLATRGLAPTPALVVIFGPAVAALLVARVLAARERRSALGGGRRSRRGIGKPEAAQSLARSWYEQFDAARDAHQPGRGPRTAPWMPWAVVGTGALSAVICAALIGPLVFVWLAGGLLLQRNAAVNTAYLTGAAELARAYRIPVDSSVSADEAGRLLHILVSTGSAQSDPMVREPAARLTSVIPEFCSAAVYGDSTRIGLGRAFDRPQLTFSPLEVRCIGDMAAHDGWRHVSRLATAGDLNFLGAYFRQPYPDSFNVLVQSTPRFGAVTRYARAAVALAAFDASQGRGAAAERRLREIISLGSVLIDGGTDGIQVLTGTVAVTIATQALGRLYEHERNPAAALALGKQRDRVLAAREDGVVLRAPQRGRNASMRAQLLTRMADESIPRGFRWDALVASEGLRCTNVGEYLFGPGKDVRRAREAFVRDVVRNPDELAYVRAIDRTSWGPETRKRLEQMFAEARVLVPLPARIAWLGRLERVIGTPGIGTCFMVADVVNAVS